VRKDVKPEMSGGAFKFPELREYADNSLGREDLYFKRQNILLLQRAVQSLRPSLRRVIDHYYGTECSVEESARALDLTLAATKSRLMRGRMRLRSALKHNDVQSAGR
jgi:DNA-directed RNA polymerase specialized sigma24 family protein